MVSKSCWKKSGGDSRLIFVNSKRAEEIQVVKTDYGNRGTFGRKRLPKWTTFKFRNNKPIPITKNVSQKRALSSARAYMKKNKC